MGQVIVRGEGMLIDAVVHTWHETKLKYEGLPARSTTRAIVNHWTGSENPPHTMFANLKKRTNALGKLTPLSVHFAIDPMGDIWQFADTETRCQHAGLANGWSIGIEHINRGNNKECPTRGIVRPVRQDIVHGRVLVYAGFTPEQIASSVTLNELLCDAYELPLRVPQIKGEVYPTVLPPQLVDSYLGVLGHLQLELKKPDPGLELLRAIHTRGQARAGRLA